LLHVLRTKKKGLVLARENDGSAGVLRALAELIGEYRWTEGIPVLLRLLHNTRNFARHPEYGHEAPFQFLVARTAAESLASFVQLPDAVVEEILGFVAQGEAVSRDVELHARLFDVLSRVQDPRIVPLFTRMLRDARVLDFRDENLYPARYAAAWALADHLNNVGNPDAIEWAEVTRGARHLDPQLAAPCLILIGGRLEANPIPEPEILDTLRAPEATEVRRALALLIMNTADHARDAARRFGILPLDHPIVAADSPDDNADSAEAPWQITPAMETWLRGLEIGKDVEGVLMRVAEVRTGLDLGAGEFDPRALRWKKPDVPLVALSEMFGME
jgi:hypothetical protein